MNPKSNSGSFDTKFKEFIKLYQQPDGILKFIAKASMKDIACISCRFFEYNYQIIKDPEITTVLYDGIMRQIRQSLSAEDREEFDRELKVLYDSGRPDLKPKGEPPRKLSRDEYVDLKLYALYYRTSNPDNKRVQGINAQEYESLNSEEAQEIRNEIAKMKEVGTKEIAKFIADKFKSDYKKLSDATIRFLISTPEGNADRKIRSWDIDTYTSHCFDVVNSFLSEEKKDEFYKIFSDTWSILNGYYDALHHEE